MLGEAQDLRAIGEERRETRGQMEIAGFELREMGHEADRRVTPGTRQASERFGQLGVREVGWSVGRHGPSYHGDFRGLCHRSPRENAALDRARAPRTSIDRGSERRRT